MSARRASNLKKLTDGCALLVAFDRSLALHVGRGADVVTASDPEETGERQLGTRLRQ